MALRAYEDRIDPATGQDVVLSSDPRLADSWRTLPAVRDYAHTALLEAQERDSKREHPQALRYVVGLEAGWGSLLDSPGEEGHDA